MSNARPLFRFPSDDRRRSSLKAVPKSIVSGDLVLEDDFEQEGETLLGTGKNAVMSKEENSEEDDGEEEEVKMERMQRSRPISMRNPIFGSPLEPCRVVQTPPKMKRPMSEYIGDERPFGVPPPTRDSSSSDDGPPPDPFQGLLAGQEGHRPRTNKPASDPAVENLEYKISESSITKEKEEQETEQPQGEQPIAPRMELRSPCKADSKPIDEQTAVSLKSLVLGSALQVFSNEWKYQSFTFCDLPKLLYGIVQKKDGPCGVLAAVQASILQHLLFNDDRKPSLSSLSPSRAQRSDSLAHALALILWRAGSKKKAVVALPSMRPHFSQSAKFKTDQLTETLILSSLTRKEDLVAFLKQNITQFELDGTSGVILALYSAVLSRGIAGVRSDMDDPMGNLMEDQSNCSQAMVNLLLTGRAVCNVFNDLAETEDNVVMKGVQGRSEVGILALSEHYKAGRVGTYLKTPRLPIWLIHSEKHFSVLFSLKKELLSDWKAERRFDLFFYDGLGRQQQEIRLTVDTSNRFFKAPTEDDMVPPLELCIRTKWCDAEIDWNGIDPIL